MFGIIIAAFILRDICGITQRNREGRPHGIWAVTFMVDVALAVVYIIYKVFYEA